MALSDYKINAFSKPVSALGDTPQMSAAELKEWFDSNSTNELKNSVNGIIDETVAELSGKVNKVAGKDLSTNDYTNEEKQKVALAVTQDELEGAIAELINGAPEALDTLKELGDALALHEDAYDALLEMVGNKANKTELATYATKEESNNILPKVNYNDLNTFQGNVAIVIREDTSKIYLFLQECASSLSGSPDSNGNGNGGIEEGGDEWEETGSEEYRQFLISAEGQIFIRTSPNHTDWTTWVEKQGQSIDTSSFATKIELDAYATKEEVGNINEALDAIIAIQDALIGGDSE